MLHILRVKDFILIREAEIEFNPGLNIITGETGAGKSLLIGALGGLLGVRMSGDLIRQGADRMVIEAEFIIQSGSPAAALLREWEEGLSESLIIRRETYRNGRTRLFLNDSPANLKRLQELGGTLVDLCGQHEHQSLLRVENHLDYLDRFADLQTSLSEYSGIYAEYRKAERHLQFLKSREKSEDQRIERAEFELREIEAVSPQPDEEDALLKEEKALEHNEQLLAFSHQVELELNSKAGSILEILSGLEKQIEKFVEYVPQFKSTLLDLRNASGSLEEVSRSALDFRRGFNFSPERLEQIHGRLGALSQLKRKYGGSISAVIKYCKNLQEEVKGYSNLEQEIKTAEKRLGSLHDELKKKAEELSSRRSQAAPDLEKAVLDELTELDLLKCAIEFRLEKRDDFTISGIDQGGIFISANPGEPLKPLSAAASGGEISRIMLALKSVLAGRDRVGCLIFDEIDSGISGKAASKAGLSLLKTSRNQQVIAITHLPQIASLPARHLSALKETYDNYAESRFILLSENERVREIANLLTTGAEEGQGEEYARELLEISQVKR